MFFSDNSVILCLYLGELCVWCYICRHYVCLEVWRSTRHYREVLSFWQCHLAGIAGTVETKRSGAWLKTQVSRPFHGVLLKKTRSSNVPNSFLQTSFPNEATKLYSKMLGGKKRRLSWAWDPTALQVPPDALVASLSLLSECCPSSESPTYHTSTQNSEPGPGKGQQAHSPVAKMNSFAKSLSVCWKTCGCQWCWSMLNNLIYNHQIIFYNHQ